MYWTEYQNMAQPLIAGATAYPEKPAVVDDDLELTYAQFNGAVNREAAFLRDGCGVVPGMRVAYLFMNCIELVQTYYAIQKIGAIAVPLNFKFIGREIAYLVNASGSCVLVYDAMMEDKVVSARALFESRVVLVSARCRAAESVKRGIADHDLMEGCQTRSEQEPSLFLRPDAVSRIQYTGGSTGAPKGAVRTHGADLVEMEAVLDSNGFASEEHPVVLVQCPMEHHGGHNWFTMAIAVGATLVICGKLDPGDILRKIEHHRVTDIIILPPATYLRLLADPEAELCDLSSVRLVQSAAGSAQRKVMEEIFRFFPNAVLNYGWGQTESGAGTSLVFTRDMLAADSPLLESVGRAMIHVEMRIVDEEGRDVQTGSTGEALVRSEAVMKGYWNEPDLTDQVLSGGWLRTGDMMRCDGNGNYYMVGRKKEMVKPGGENVFVGEVEDAINKHSQVVDCVVFGSSDQLMGESVSAIVQRVPGSDLTPDGLRDWCKSMLASYKKPRHILFVESIGRDESGKINKQQAIEYFESHYHGR